jgi:hypothetical protein
MKYRVQIKATVIKDVFVTANNKPQAAQYAHEEFNILCVPGESENYMEETLEVEELSEPEKKGD